MKRYIFSEQVLTGAGATKANPMLLAIDGQRISAVTSMSRQTFSTYSFPEDADVLDLESKLITPTFINAHTHLAMTVFRGIGTQAFGGNIVEDLYYRLESELTAQDVKSFARYAAYESILSGTGMVWDHYYYGLAVAEGLAEAGLPAVIAPTLQDINGPGVTQLEDQLLATEALTNSQWSERGIYSALGPHATDTVSDGLWREVVDVAKKANLPIHVHVSQSPEEYERLMNRTGCSPIQFLHTQGVMDVAQPKLFVHGLYASAADLASLRGHDVVLGYCPNSQVQFGFPARVSDWTGHGLSVAMGTDCGASNDSMDVQQELRLAANGHAFAVTHSSVNADFYATGTADAAQAVENLRLQRRKAHAQDADMVALLDTIWTTPGKLHHSAKCGELAPGHLANFAIWNDTHPCLWPLHNVHRSFVMNHTSPALVGVFLMGKQRGRIGDFQRSIMEETGYQESRLEAEARRKSFLKRLNLI